MPVSQYSVMLSRMWSRVRPPDGCPSTKARETSRRRPCRGRASRPPGRRVNPAERSRSSAAAWPAPGSSRSRSPGMSWSARSRAFLFGFRLTMRRRPAPSPASFMWMPSSPLGPWRPIVSVTEGALVAALGDIAGVAEAVHQLRPGACDAAGAPADLGRLGGEAVAGQGRQHPGRTRPRRARRARPGRWSGPTAPSSSITEPGQPCVMISGSASGCGDFTWMKWMSTRSISVLNCGSALSLVSSLRKS